MPEENVVNQKMTLQVFTDKPVIAQDGCCERVLEITLTAPKRSEKLERAPLNLSFVLDRSGSMSGEKLQFVKQAAAHVIDLLSEQDHASVVAYDDHVTVISASQKMSAENKALVKTHIHSIFPGGSTNLFEGWLRGCHEVATAATEQTINRTLLLTDGLANVGIKDVEEISTHCRELFKRGVTTSCFGVGLHYNEHMLEAMANNGGGNFHFLETLNAIPVVFEREFEELMDVSARSVEIKVDLPQPVKTKVYSGWSFEKHYDHLMIFPGNLYSGQTLSIYIELHFDQGLDCDELVIPVLVRGRGEGDAFYEERMELTLKAVSSEEEANTKFDSDLMERFTSVDLAEVANEALKLERSGDRAAAALRLNDSVQRRQSHMSTNLKDKYAHLSRELQSRMSEEIRKRRHQEEYETRRGRERFRDYRVVFDKGYPIVKIDGANVLIDTCTTKSTGNRPEWFFLDRIYPLLPDFKAGKLEYLSSLLHTRVDILLGTDILHEYFVTMDAVNSRVHFSGRPLMDSDHDATMVSTWRAQVAPCMVAQTPCRMFLDSSSRLSYVERSLTAGLTPLREETGYHLETGEFSTPIYQVPVNLGGINFELRCGVLPEPFERELFEDKRNGIIGAELLHKFVVAYDFPLKKLRLRTPASAA
ncbi:vWA domain-containing protein [Levilinea saccharolytica]|uniref:vWA domain-containing protein n=1 Tax=Levilinea saccharolytica TaxID=229921 RepID=UPI0009462891|nr:VWA domain-containing protein [Levilinea saccharolytica]GAP16276.1 uncharacterized protein containing a von Willebrand factor type A (vWA) domain [Levilinea saccharolytica]